EQISMANSKQRNTSREPSMVYRCISVNRSILPGRATRERVFSSHTMFQTDGIHRCSLVLREGISCSCRQDFTINLHVLVCVLTWGRFQIVTMQGLHIRKDLPRSDTVGLPGVHSILMRHIMARTM